MGSTRSFSWLIVLAMLVCAPGCVTTIAWGAIVTPEARPKDVKLAGFRFVGDKAFVDVDVTYSDGDSTRLTDVRVDDDWPPLEPTSVQSTKRCLFLCGGFFGLSRVFPPRLMNKSDGQSFELEGDGGAGGGQFHVPDKGPTVGSYVAFFASMPLWVALDAVFLPFEALFELVKG